MLQGELHMTAKIPSYLTLRDGIYYFQLRVSKHLAYGQFSGKTLIRRSTRTGNRREALAIARLWWIELMGKQKSSNILKTQRVIDASADGYEQLYRRGKILFQKLSEADPDDGLEIEEIVLDEFGKGGFTEEFDRTALQYYQTLQAQKSGTAGQQSAAAQPAKTSQKGNIRLSELLEKYINHKSSGLNATVDKTRDMYRRQLSIMVEMVGDPLANELDAELLTEKYGLRIHKTPLRINNNKQYHDKNGKRKSIEEIFKIADKVKDERISVNSVKDYIGRVQTFLKWGYDLGYFEKNLASVLDKHKKKKISKKDKITALPFSDNELKKLFGSDDYRQGQWLRNKTFRHWVPLIGLYTGARLGEICQLYVDDIKHDKDLNIWYFRLTDEGGNRRLKTSSSERIVPVHKSLIDLGFIDYIKHQKARKQQQVFEELSADKYGHWTRKTGRWFNEQYLEQCGISTASRNERKSFHSFRHTFINYCKQKRLDTAVAMEIVGHASSNKVHQNYQDDFELQTKWELLKEVNFCIDLAGIKQWK